LSEWTGWRREAEKHVHILQVSLMVKFGPPFCLLLLIVPHHDWAREENTVNSSRVPSLGSV